MNRKKWFIGILFIYVLCMTACGKGYDGEEKAHNDVISEAENLEESKEKDEGVSTEEEIVAITEEMLEFNITQLGSLYDEVKSEFEYEKYDTLTLRQKENVEYVSFNTSSSWAILPEYFEDYDGDGKKDVLRMKNFGYGWGFDKVSEEPSGQQTSQAVIPSYICPMTYAEAEIYWYISHSGGKAYLICESAARECDRTDNGTNIVIVNQSNYLIRQQIMIYDLANGDQKECLYCNKYYENDELRDIYLMAEENSVFQGLYSNRGTANALYTNFSDASSEMKNRVDKYVSAYRESDNIIPLAAVKMIPLERETFRDENGFIKAEDAAIIKLSYNNLWDSGSISIQEALETEKSSCWVDEYVREVNKKVEQIEDSQSEYVKYGSGGLEIYLDQENKIKLVRYPKMFYDDFNADMKADFYWEDSKIICCILRWSSDAEGVSALEKYMHDNPEETLNYIVYVQDSIVYRITDNITFHKDSNTEELIWFCFNGSEWWVDMLGTIDVFLENTPQ